MKLLLNTLIFAALTALIITLPILLMLLCKYHPLIGVITVLMLFSLGCVYSMDIRFIK
jgi:hypothetical protein